MRTVGALWGVVVAAPLLLCGPAAAAGPPLGAATIAGTTAGGASVSTSLAPAAETTDSPGTGLTGPDPADPSSAAPDPTDQPTEEPSGVPSDETSTAPGTPETTEPPSPEETTAVPSDEPAEVTPTPEITETPGEQEAPVLDPIPPASSNHSGSTASWIIAVVVLVASGLLLLLLRRRETPPLTDSPTATTYGLVPPAEGTPATPGAPVEPSGAPGAVTFSAIEAVGEAMLDATYSVITIETALEDIARVNAYPATEVVVLPTALFVSTRGGGELYTGAISSGRRKLLLHQVDALDELVRGARSGELRPGEIIRGIRDLRAAPPPFSFPARIAAHVLLCAAIAVIMGASLAGIAIAAVLGGIVGAARLLSAQASRQREPLVTVALSFGAATAVFLLARTGMDPGILPSLVAPLVTLLPGALLTTGIIELAAGQMMSGAGRLMAGFMQLALLAVGIVAGGALVGVPEIVLTGADNPIGPAAPWVAVAAFGVGVVVHQCGRPGSIPWILLVLYVAYGAQVIGNIFFGGVLSALVGAFVMTPVAVLVSRHRSGPAAAVSFLPAFWLLVPGALGLVGVAELLGGDGDGMSTVVTTIWTMIAIALGILAGSALGGRSGATHRDVL